MKMTEIENCPVRGCNRKLRGRGNYGFCIKHGIQKRVK